ncbi:hypothetical protein [Thermocatellispora tengchongensis]|uniref:hypothetical protein n=1 Tax=Thermocatellispora tengchongensis TaxID=1073253 RepID=UPI00362CD43F
MTAKALRPPGDLLFVKAGAKVAAACAGLEDPDEVVAALLGPASVHAVDIERVSAGPWPVPDPAGVALLARTPTDLRRLVSLRGALPSAVRVMVAILETPSWFDTPQVVMSRGVGQRVLRECRVHRLGASGWLITTRFSKEQPAGDVAAAITRGMTGFHLNAHPLPAVALGDPALADWWPGDPDASCGGAPEKSGVPSAELGLRLPDAEWPDRRVPVLARPPWEHATWTAIGAPGGYERLARLDPGQVPPVDERSVNPRGFLRTPAKGIGDIVLAGGRWTARLDGRDLVAFPESGLVTDTDVDRLRRLRALRLSWRPAHTGPIAAARVVAGLAAAGVPLIAPSPPRPGPRRRWARTCCRCWPARTPTSPTICGARS